MSKKRANGEGNIRKRKDGRWEGRYTAGYDKDGKAITKNVLGKTQAEVKEKLKTAIEESQKLDPTRTRYFRAAACGRPAVTTPTTGMRSARWESARVIVRFFMPSISISPS